MHLRTLAAATALGLVASLAPTVAAEAAAKPTYRVSISTSATKADVGRTIKVSGKVAGPNAAKKRLAVQVRAGKGAWKTVAKVRTTKSRRYAAKVKVTTAGSQSIRVLAPKSKRAHAGKSTTRSFTGWRWLDLTQQEFATTGPRPTTGRVTVAGTVYPKAWTVISRTALYFDGAQSCDTFKSAAALLPGTTDPGLLLSATAPTLAPDDGSQVTQGSLQLQPGAAPRSFRMNLAGQRMFAFLNAGSDPVAIVAPLAHCSVNSLTAPAVPSL